MGAILSTPGVDSLGTHKFRHRGSHREIVAECVSVEFRRVLKSSNLRTESDVSNWQEALHALVALYNTCLPNITPELLYSTVCTKEARSLMLVMSPEAALEDLCFRHGTTCVMEGNTASTTERSTTDSLFSTGGDQVEEKSYHIGGRDYQKVTGLGDCQKDDVTKSGDWCPQEFTKEEEEAAQEVCPNCRKSKYASVYSDESDSSSDSQSDSDTTSEANSSDDEDKYMVGADLFLENVSHRRATRQNNIDNNMGLSLINIGIENRIFAAVTFEKRQLNDKRITYLTVLSVRRRMRGLKLGCFLVKLVIKLSGSQDPLVVLADDDAIEFFEKQGFINDFMICSKYDELKKEGSWTNCTVMVRLPKLIPDPDVGIGDLTDAAVEKLVNEKVESWQNASLNLYQQQASLIAQLKREILKNRETMTEQQKIIKNLTREIENKTGTTLEDFVSSSSNSPSKLKDSTHVSDIEYEIENLNLEYMDKNQNVFNPGDTSSGKSSAIAKSGDPKLFSEFVVVTPTDDLGDEIKKNRLEVSIVDHNETKISKSGRQQQLQEILEMFLYSIRDSNPTLFDEMKILDVHPIHNSLRTSITSSNVESRLLYFCGSLTSEKDLAGIKERGVFSCFHFTHGDFGVGLYFSRFAEVAVKFSKVNQILVAEVNFGKQRTVLTPDAKRCTAGTGFDTVLTPGRLSGTISPRETTENKEKLQEIIVFDLKRAVPKYIIQYER